MLHTANFRNSGCIYIWNSSLRAVICMLTAIEGNRDSCFGSDTDSLYICLYSYFELNSFAKKRQDALITFFFFSFFFLVGCFFKQSLFKLLLNGYRNSNIVTTPPKIRYRVSLRGLGLEKYYFSPPLLLYYLSIRSSRTEFSEVITSPFVIFAAIVTKLLVWWQHNNWYPFFLIRCPLKNAITGRVNPNLLENDVNSVHMPCASRSN